MATSQLHPATSSSPATPTNSEKSPYSLTVEGASCITTPAASQDASAPKTLFSWTVALVAGVVWGFVFEKSRVFECRAIRGQMVFERWVMLKMFLGAMGISAFCLALTAFVDKPRFDLIRNKFRAGCQRGVFSATALGAFILGIGMSVSSACPGMVLAQVGAGQKNSLFTVFGGLLGCVLYAMVDKKMQSFIQSGYVFPPDKRFADEFLGIDSKKTPYLIIFIGCFALSVSGLIEALRSWDSMVVYDGAGTVVNTYENDFQNDCNGNVFKCRSWPPSISGLILGFLQIILINKFSTCMGSATAYQSIVATPFLLVGEEKRKKMKEGWLDYWVTFTPANVSLQWQIFYCTGCLLGALISASMSETYGEAPGMPPWQCVLGGFLMLFGGRLAAGCTSSHGISGFPMLQNSSIVAVPAMFGGGIAAAFVMKAAMGDDFYPAYEDSVVLIYGA
mmetsp:Transcript_14624/g.30004  ORF Transcript_14624/g.30004 Transcript_14624/m.30004 type:complete len:449 (-) Transcript_14624:32-1378(-)